MTPKSEDAASVRTGGDIGFATEEDLRNNNFPQELISSFFGSMQVGDYTQPTQMRGKWFIFKLAERRLQTENLTLENVRAQITQGLTNQRKQILNEALMETAMNEAKIVNNLASQMLGNPNNLGLRPAGSNASQPASSPAQQSASPSPPSATSSPVTVNPVASPTK